MKKLYKSFALVAASLLLVSLTTIEKASAGDGEYGTHPGEIPKMYGGDGGGENMDGSDCKNGTIYNHLAEGCLYPDEIGCNRANPCANGQVCVKAKEYPGEIKIIERDEGKNPVGICIVSKSISSDSNPLSMAMCSFYNFLTGSTGRILIALVVVSIGITFLFGKVEFKTLLNVLLGTAVIFGAPFMVKVFLGSGFEC